MCGGSNSKALIASMCSTVVVLVVLVLVVVVGVVINALASMWSTGPLSGTSSSLRYLSLNKEVLDAFIFTSRFAL